MVSKLRAGTLPVVIILLAAFTAHGCGASNTVKGGAIGAGAGGAVGALIGRAAGNTAAGAIVGAAVGGTAGALIGRYMDKQKEEMERDLKGAKVERVGEGLKITFDSGILFTSGSSNLQPASQQNIKKLSEILNKYPDTNILIEGHTDNSGTHEVNQNLSEKRAESVSAYALGQNVAKSRITTVGYGETQPLTSNETADGREQNRRVEVAIFANEKLKDAAKNGNIK
jgi:outer membrane protein OmpA-like peptidoglycan-associated protein